MHLSTTIHELRLDHAAKVLTPNGGRCSLAQLGERRLTFQTQVTRDGLISQVRALRSFGSPLVAGILFLLLDRDTYVRESAPHLREKRSE